MSGLVSAAWAALESYRQAMEINARWWPAWHNRAVFWARKGDTAKAISDFEMAHGLATGNADIMRDLGTYYDRARRLSDAEQSLRQSLELRESPRAYTALALIRERQGRPAESAEFLEKAAGLRPRSHLIYYYLASSWSLVTSSAPCEWP